MICPAEMQKPTTHKMETMIGRLRTVADISVCVARSAVQGARTLQHAALFYFLIASTGSSCAAE